MPVIETGVVSRSHARGRGRGARRRGGGKVVFVAGALPGERISFRRRSFHKSHDEAELVEMLEASPQRVTPRCAHFGVCGGCALQHLDPAAQIEAKQKELAIESRAHRQRHACRVAATVVRPALELSPARAAVLALRHEEGRSLVGFREKQGKYVADVQRCEVLAEPVARWSDRWPTCSPAWRAGRASRRSRWRCPMANACSCVRVLDPLPEPDLERLREFERTHGLRILLQPGGLDTIAPLTPGPVDLHYRLDEFDLKTRIRADRLRPGECRHQPGHGRPGHRTTGDRPVRPGPGPVLRPRQLHAAPGAAGRGR